MPAQEAFQHVVSRREDVAHVMKNGESESFPKEGHGDGGETKFHVVHKQGRATYGETGSWVAWPCLIQPETAMRVSAAGEELFRQRNGGDVDAGGLAGLVQRARSRGQDSCSTELLFQPDAG